MFDPYHKWLGIAPHEQPPDHYRLLGLSRFEADAEVIDAAANRQMAYLQGCAGGDHAALSQRLLNEVAAARLSLLNPVAKSVYDATLRATRSPERLPAVVIADAVVEPVIEPLRRTRYVPPPPVPQRTILATVDEPTHTRETTTQFSLNIQFFRNKSHRRNLWVLASVLLLGLGSLLLAGLIGAWLQAPPRPVVVQVGPDPAQIAAAVESALPHAPIVESSPRPALAATPRTRVATADPEPVKAPGAPWISLFGGVDVFRDSLGERRWSLIDGNLVSPDGDSILSVPGPVPRRYKLRLRINKGSEKMFGVGLMIGSRQHFISFDTFPDDGCLSKFDVVDGRGQVFHQGSRLLPLLQNRTIECDVSEDSIVVKVDDREVGRWHGNFERLSVHPAWSYGRRGQLFLASAGRGTEVRAIELLPRSDEKPSGQPPRREWQAPALASYPESRYQSLFRNRTIDAPLTDMSNCSLDQAYGDFALRFQYKLRTHADQPWTGVRLRHGSGSRLSLVVSEGECGGLLLDRSPPNLAPGLTERRLDEIHRIVQPARNAEGPYGSWNDCDVVCVGSRTTVAINGMVVNEISNGPTGRGLICLAGFEQGAAFRFVRVVDLDPSEPTTAADRPTILRWRHNDWQGSTFDFAERDGDRVHVGMGAQDFGIGEVGFEASGLSRVRAEVSTAGTFKVLDANSGAGFMVDYHTVNGYAKRVFCVLGDRAVRRFSPVPACGKATVPDQVVTIPYAAQVNLDLKRWSPDGWDGQVWFTLIMQNTGKNTWIRAKLEPLK